MKIKIYFLLILVLIVSCSKNKEQSTKEEQISELNLDVNSNENLKDWFDYYASNDSTFDLNNFKFESKDTLEFIDGNILGIYDKGFDSIYANLLVFNPDKTKYIDLDSYQWRMDENNVLSSEADQEIDLVDIKNKKITRIGFYGPGECVEDAFWKNDSTVVLLENNAEDIPGISIINLNKQTSETFIYNSKLSFETDYTRYRFNKKGLKI